MSPGLRNTLLLMAFYALCMWGFARWMETSRIQTESGYTRETIERVAREKASLLSEAIWVAKGAPAPFGREQLKDEIRSLTSVSDLVSSISVVDSSGRVVASDTLKFDAQLPVPTEVFRGRSPAEPFIVPPQPGQNPFESTLYYPLWGPQSLVGYIRMTIQEAGLQVGVRKIGDRFFLEMIMGLLVVCIISILLQLRMSRASLDLSRALESALTAHPVRITPRNDEFAAAYQAAERVRLALTESRTEEARAGGRISALTNMLDIGLLWFRPDLELEFANTRALELLGVGSLEELRGIWPQLGGPVREAMHGLQRGGGSRTALVLRVPAAGGNRFSVQVHAVGEDGAQGFVATLTDVGVIEALEGSVHLAGQVENLARAHSAVVHELRSPLGAILANLDQMRGTLTRSGIREPGFRQTQERYIGVLQTELTRLKQSLFDVMAEMQPYTKGVERFDLRELALDLKKLTQAQARRQGVELKLEPGDRPLTVVGQRDRLRQAFLNILVNALEAMPKGGQLRIDLTSEAHLARAVFTDTGPGIPRDGAHKIFDLGFSTKRGGTGTGLHIARALVEQHQGRLAAGNSTSGGAEFTLELPLATVAAEAECRTS